MSTPEVPAGGGPVLPTDAGAPVDSGPSTGEEQPAQDGGAQDGGAQGDDAPDA